MISSYGNRHKLVTYNSKEGDLLHTNNQIFVLHLIFYLLFQNHQKRDFYFIKVISLDEIVIVDICI